MDVSKYYNSALKSIRKYRTCCCVWLTPTSNDFGVWRYHFDKLIFLDSLPGKLKEDTSTWTKMTRKRHGGNKATVGTCGSVAQLEKSPLYGSACRRPPVGAWGCDGRCALSSTSDTKHSGQTFRVESREVHRCQIHICFHTSYSKSRIAQFLRLFGFFRRRSRYIQRKHRHVQLW